MTEVKVEGIPMDDINDPSGKLRLIIYSLLQDREADKRRIIELEGGVEST